MKLLLLGYGKMGQLIEKLAIAQGHEVVAKISSSNSDALDTLSTTDVDVAIEFTNPDAVIDNIYWCIDHHIPVVVGTTGWLSRKAEVDDYCKSNNGTYLYASNFSIGVNLFFEINEALAKLMNNQKSYAPAMLEVHHTQKLDAPSGTAITLAEGIINAMERLTSWTDQSNPGAQELPIASERVDPTPGTHVIKYDSEVDSIEIKHTAHSRQGFASGALAVAEWIQDKKGVLHMKDYLAL